MPRSHPDVVGTVLALVIMVCGGVVLTVDLRWGVFATLPERSARRPWSRILFRAFWGWMIVVGALQAWDHLVRLPSWTDVLYIVVNVVMGLCALGFLLAVVWARRS